MNTSRLSVALCTFNGSRFLPEQLASLASQTHPPHELVISDDGSTDSTESVINEFIRRAPFSVRFHKNTKSLGSTRNFEQAIAQCQGEVIVLSDQDDVWMPNRLAETEKAFRNTPDAGAFFSNAEIVDASLNPLGYRLWDVVRFTSREQKRFAHGQAVPTLLKRNVVTGATLAIQPEFRKLILPIPEDWVHDAWIALLIASVSKVTFSTQPLIKYRQHSDNQIGARQREFTEQLERARVSHADIYAAAAANFTAVRNRLLTVNNPAPPANVLRLLEAKIAHMQARAHLPKSRIRRLPAALSELAAGRYHCYSNSWKSFARDICF